MYYGIEQELAAMIEEKYQRAKEEELTNNEEDAHLA